MVVLLGVKVFKGLKVTIGKYRQRLGDLKYEFWGQYGSNGGAGTV